MTVFRIKKQEITRCVQLSSAGYVAGTESEGFLSLIPSLLENWDYTMKGLARICEDGIGSISSSVRDLETHGYPIDTRSKESDFETSL